MATDLTKAADVPRLKKTIKAILHLRFEQFVGVALLHLRFGPSVGVEHFSKLQNATFDGPYFTTLVLDRQNLDHLLEMLLVTRSQGLKASSAFATQGLEIALPGGQPTIKSPWGGRVPNRRPKLAPDAAI